MPPTNIDFASALDIGTTLPFTISQDASGLAGPDYGLYYKYTAQPSDAATGTIGIWASAPIASNYATFTTIYLETSPGVWTEYDLFIEPYQVPAQVPVAVGTEYFFEVFQDNGVAPNANLTFSVIPAPTTAIDLGSLLISDFSTGFFGAILSPVDGTVLTFKPTVAAADFGDILPNGITGWVALTGAMGNPPIRLLDTDFNIIADVAGLTNGAQYQQIRANGSSLFYVGRNNNGNSSVISTVSQAGVVGGTTWTLGANSKGLVAMAPTRDNLILYYGGVNGGSADIHRHDLLTDMPLSDFVTAPAGYLPDKDLLVMSDGSVLVVWRNFPNDQIIRYDATGATLNTYLMPVGESLDRIALNKTDGVDSFWVWTFKDQKTCTYRELRVSDGVVLTEFDVTQFNNGTSAADAADDMVRFGVSNSCPLIVLRTGVVPPPECPGLVTVPRTDGLPYVPFTPS